MITCIPIEELYKCLGSRYFASLFLSSALPKYGRTLRAGQNYWSSFYQLWRVVTGTIIRNGPQTSFFSARWASKAMVYIVLPKPISSARIPLIP